MVDMFAKEKEKGVKLDGVQEEVTRGIGKGKASAKMLGSYNNNSAGALKRTSSFRGSGRLSKKSNEKGDGQGQEQGQGAGTGGQGVVQNLRKHGTQFQVGLKKTGERSIKKIMGRNTKPKPRRKPPPSLSWQVFKTPEGIPYYYHPSTGQTVWEKPAEEEEQPQQSGAPEKDAKQSKADVSPDGEQKSLNRTFSDRLMKKGKGIMNFGEKKLKRPPTLSKIAKENDKPSVVNAGSSTSAGGESGDGASPWKEHKDESGQVYYYNEQTHETSWEHPDEPSCESASAAATDNITNDSGDVWREATTENGDTYYWNKVTGESRYERPAEYHK